MPFAPCPALCYKHGHGRASKHPNLQEKIDRWVSETGRGPNELVEDAVAGYFAEMAQTRDMLNSRYDDLKSGMVKPINGDEFFENLRCREDQLLNKQPS